jgi:hypothetical protein
MKFNNQLEAYENLTEYLRSLRQEEDDELEAEDAEELMSEAEYLEDR